MGDERQVRAPGTWRVVDGTAVPFAQARAAWAVAAREVLIRTATRYGGYITYGALAEQVQESSGIRTRSQMRNWIGGVLGEVVTDCHARGEPALTSLCVHQDETVGDGYAYVLRVAGVEGVEDLDQHAAQARLECYRFFGATLPPGGGSPALTPRVAAARRRAATQVEPPMRVCPTCFIQLPSSGRCDHCT